MGTTLDAIVERFYAAEQVTPSWQRPDMWEAVCRWEFNKDYALMFALRDHARCQLGWPAVASADVKRLEREDAWRAYWFVGNELPTSFDDVDYAGKHVEPNERYRAMVAGLSELKGPVRVVFLEI